ncbi:hypothetical protein C8J57DRAFT_1643680 [Mycena rebaudengoi]|nr:hypothetical protein C8J57DRAFT_1643680 [Mycena rebaudengoi]
MIPRQNLAPHLLNRMRSAGRGAGTVQYRPIAGLSTASLPRARSHAASTPGDTHPRLHTHRSSGGCRGRGATWWRGWRYGTSGMTRRGAAEVASCGKSAGRRKSSCKCLAYGEGGQVRISMRRTWVERADEWNLASRGAGQRNGVGAVTHCWRNQREVGAWGWVRESGIARGDRESDGRAGEKGGPGATHGGGLHDKTAVPPAFRGGARLEEGPIWARARCGGVMMGRSDPPRARQHRGWVFVPMLESLTQESRQAQYVRVFGTRGVEKACAARSSVDSAPMGTTFITEIPEEASCVYACILMKMRADETGLTRRRMAAQREERDAAAISALQRHWVAGSGFRGSR